MSDFINYNNELIYYHNTQGTTYTGNTNEYYGITKDKSATVDFINSAQFIHNGTNVYNYFAIKAANELPSNMKGPYGSSGYTGQTEGNGYVNLRWNSTFSLDYNFFVSGRYYDGYITPPPPSGALAQYWYAKSDLVHFSAGNRLTSAFITVSGAYTYVRYTFSGDNPHGETLNGITGTIDPETKDWSAYIHKNVSFDLTDSNTTVNCLYFNESGHSGVSSCPLYKVANYQNIRMPLYYSINLYNTPLLVTQPWFSDPRLYSAGTSKETYTKYDDPEFIIYP